VWWALEVFAWRFVLLRRQRRRHWGVGSLCMQRFQSRKSCVFHHLLVVSTEGKQQILNFVLMLSRALGLWRAPPKGLLINLLVHSASALSGAAARAVRLDPNDTAKAVPKPKISRSYMPRERPPATPSSSITTVQGAGAPSTPPLLLHNRILPQGLDGAMAVTSAVRGLSLAALDTEPQALQGENNGSNLRSYVVRRSHMMMMMVVEMMMMMMMIMVVVVVVVMVMMMMMMLLLLLLLLMMITRPYLQWTRSMAPASRKSVVAVLLHCWQRL
jgi:hypothetical protein